MPRWKAEHCEPTRSPLHHSVFQGLQEYSSASFWRTILPTHRRDGCAALDSTVASDPRSLTVADSRWNLLQLASSKGSLLLCERLWGWNGRKNIKWGAEGSQRTSLLIKAKEHKYKALMISLTVCKKKKYRLLVCHIINVFPTDSEAITSWSKPELIQASKET